MKKVISYQKKRNKFRKKQPMQVFQQIRQVAALKHLLSGGGSCIFTVYHGGKVLRKKLRFYGDRNFFLMLVSGHTGIFGGCEVAV